METMHEVTECDGSRWRISPESHEWQGPDGSWLRVSGAAYRAHIAGIGHKLWPVHSLPAQPRPGDCDVRDEEATKHEPPRVYKNPLTPLLMLWFGWMAENPWWGFTALIIGNWIGDGLLE